MIKLICISVSQAQLIVKSKKLSRLIILMVLKHQNLAQINKCQRIKVIFHLCNLVLNKYTNLLNLLIQTFLKMELN